MKLHIITVGEPKMEYAREGWALYTKRLQRFHSLELTYIPDKRANDGAYLLLKASDAYLAALAVQGSQMDSPGLAAFLETRAASGKVLCCMIGGPEGLPDAVTQKADMLWSLSPLTFPHDLAMVMTVEALYRASTIAAGHPYHK